VLKQESIELSKWRIEKAKSSLQESQNNIDDESYEASANRSYYAVFHAIRALLALEGVDFKKHSSVISYFRENYIKTLIFDKEYSNIVGKAFEVRGNADYQDFFVISKEEVQEQLNNATKFVNTIEIYLQEKYVSK